MLLFESGVNIFITPYVHIYEMFAGISAAMVGISEIRELTATRFGEKFSVRSQMIQGDIGKLIANIRQSQRVWKEIKPKVKKIPSVITTKIDAHDLEINGIEDWAIQMNQRYDIKNEQDKVIKIVYSLCVIVFLFTTSLMFLIASVSNDLMLPDKAMVHVAHSEIFIIICLILSSWQINKDHLNKYSVFLIYILSFIISEFIALLLTYKIDGGMKTINVLILITSLLVCAFPIVAVSVRTYIIWWYRFKTDDKIIAQTKLRCVSIQNDYQEFIELAM